MTTHALRAVGIRKAFGKNVVLDRFDLDLTVGEVTVLLGGNGAGKSTLMRMALGSERATLGTIEVLGRDPLRQQSAVLQRVGYVPSVPDVYDWMTPVDLFRFLRAQYSAWDDDWCAELIALLEVPETTTFGNMSRGQGMKTMLVAALAPRPELLLLDEPFAGLDPLVRDEVLAGVIASLRDEACTVLCATHDLEIAARMADRVAVLADGRITRHGPIAEFVEEHVSVPNALKTALAADRALQEVSS
jgi:ABC-2 type transport system ATP-binding protein